ncbi:MAG: alpha/beta hydrolase, partial [Actinobacteria bacterium]|nr:alpha/beta hydrolase [Actinomycetota bacterium]
LYTEVDDSRAASIDDDATVIFVHGYTLNQNCWHFQRRDLRPQARLIFADQRSHGSSERSDRDHSTVDQLGLDLGEIIDQIGGDGPIVLVGHSMGGMTIMALAAARPELFMTGRVGGVAFLATSAGGLSKTSLGLPAPVGALLHKLAPRLLDAALAQGDLIEFGRRYGNDLGLLLTNRYSFGSHVSPDLTTFTAEMINATPIEVIAEFLPGLEAHEKTEALSAMLTTEVLVMVGESDVQTPPEHSAEIDRLLPNAELQVLPETGHMIMLERYPEVTHALLLLIDRVRERVSKES